MIMGNMRIYLLYSLLLLKVTTKAEVHFNEVDESGEDVIVEYNGTEITGGSVLRNKEIVKNLTVVMTVEKASEDMTEIVCDPGTTSASVVITAGNIPKQYELADNYLLPREAYGCSVESGQVTIQREKFRPHCYYGGTVRYDDHIQNITIAGGRLKARVDIFCNESPDEILEIWSRFNVSIGSCNIDAFNCKGKELF